MRIEDTVVVGGAAPRRILPLHGGGACQWTDSEIYGRWGRM